MQPDELLLILHTAEKLKDTTRHCCTSAPPGECGRAQLASGSHGLLSPG